MKGLALSGGGYRATLFSLGSLIRLNEMGLLYWMDEITSVSGGSITSGYLAYKWDSLHFEDMNGSFVATNFDEEVTVPLMRFCQHRIDVPAGIAGFFSFKSTIGDKVREKYDQLLFHGKLLAEVATKETAPRFIFYGTNYDTGVSVQICKKEVRDWRIGVATNHHISIAEAVGVSSAFPPVFSPIVLDGSKWTWSDDAFSDLQSEKHLRKKLALCDGGLYDNMGIERLWKTGENKEFDSVFVCDAGAPMEVPYTKAGKKIKKNWVSQFNRMTSIMINQQRALRKRWLIDNYKSKEYAGTYWGIDVDISEYLVNDPLLRFDGEYKKLQNLGTQLSPFSKKEEIALVNWGYALTDAAIRSFYDRSIPAGKLPR